MKRAHTYLVDLKHASHVSKFEVLLAVILVGDQVEEERDVPDFE